MTKQNPYPIIKHVHVTEKATMLQNLKRADSNPSLRACQSPKYVFIVDVNANKKQIAQALQEIYKDENIKVKAVNTINVKPKQKRRGQLVGKTKGFKKAIVTLENGHHLDQFE